MVLRGIRATVVSFDLDGIKWSYFVGQSEGKAKVDSDWF